jgi:hypothetical protein
LPDDGKNIVHVVARIDDHGFVRSFIANHGAVTLQRADGKDLMDHDLIFAHPVRFHHTQSP